MTIELHSVITDLLELHRLSVRDGRVPSVLGVLRRDFNHSFRNTVVVFKSRPIALVSTSSLASVDVSLDALLSTTAQVSSVIILSIIAVVRHCTILLDLGVRNWHCEVLLKSFVRVTNFTKNVNWLEVPAALAARVSLKSAALTSMLPGGTGVASIHLLEVVEVLLCVLDVLLEYLRQI